MNGAKKAFDGTDIYGPFANVTASRHLTMFFNIFVFMQIWNMIAARKINDELNLFSGLHTNAMFLSVFVIIIIGQYVIVQFTGIVF